MEYFNCWFDFERKLADSQTRQNQNVQHPIVLYFLAFPPSLRLPLRTYRLAEIEDRNIKLSSLLPLLHPLLPFSYFLTYPRLSGCDRSARSPRPAVRRAVEAEDDEDDDDDYETRVACGKERRRGTLPSSRTRRREYK